MNFRQICLTLLYIFVYRWIVDEFQLPPLPTFLICLVTVAYVIISKALRDE